MGAPPAQRTIPDSFFSPDVGIEALSTHRGSSTLPQFYGCAASEIQREAGGAAPLDPPSLQLPTSDFGLPTNIMGSCPWFSGEAMLQFTGDGSVRTCDGITRRDFLQVGVLGAIGLGLPQLNA